MGECCRQLRADGIKPSGYPRKIALLSIHSNPLGPMGTRDTGGMSVCVLEQAKYLGKTGHRVDIFTYVHGRDVTLWPNVRLIHLADKARSRIPEKNTLPALLPEIFKALVTFGRSNGSPYDLIHSHYWLSGMVGAMVQPQWGCPHILTFHTLAKMKNETHTGRPEPDKRVAGERWLTRMVDRIIVPTDKEKINLVTRYGARPATVAVIPNGVDPERFKPGDPFAARRKLGLPSTGPLLLYVGRFAALKGLDRLVTATAQLRRLFPLIRLILVGGDGSRSQTTRDLKKLTQNLKIEPHVHFAGQIDQADLPDYYNTADIVVLPSHYESFGLVVLEALACGTPVAATPVGVAEAVIRDGVNGIIMPTPDVDDMVRALRQWLDGTGRAGPSRESIRSTVLEYDWRRIGNELLRTYSHVRQSFNLSATAGRPDINSIIFD